MKTEELKAQGLTEEQISFVMAENGKRPQKVAERKRQSERGPGHLERESRSSRNNAERL